MRAEFKFFIFVIKINISDSYKWYTILIQLQN